MKINAIMSFFTPKDMMFLPLLKKLSEIADKSATLLQDLFASTETNQMNELCGLIKIEEKNGDIVTGEIFKALNETFITPFDREDITVLTDEMDDIIDIINSVARKIMLYSPETLIPEMLEMAVVIKKGAVEIKNAVYELPNIKKYDKQIRLHTKQIKHLEQEADALYELGTSKLFKSNIRPEELIKLKEIIQDLERIANKINSVGKILKTIIIKYT